jgi:hypothetical protein
MISYVLAFLAATVNAVGDVLNREASRQVPRNLAFRLSLFADLLHRPAWLTAAAMMLASFVLAAAALGTGQLAAVQLIVILELPLTMVGSAWFLGGRLPASDWAAIGLMTAGVAGLLALLDPQPGDVSGVPPVVWLAASTVNAGLIAGLYLVARAQRRPAVRAALLGVASGCGYGLTAAFTKGMAAHYAAGGVGGVLTSWQLYACGAAGLTSTWLLQNAYHAGTLAAAQPGVTLADPVLATLWGTVAFGEPVRHGEILVLTALPLAAITAGVLVLSRSRAWRLNKDRPPLRPRPTQTSRARAGR